MYRLIIILLFVPFMGYTQAVTDGLVGYWPFNGNANDESGNGHDGQVIGANLTQGKDSEENTSYLLSIPNYIVLGNDDAFNFGEGEFSIAAWIYKTSSNTNWNTAFLDKWNTGAKPGTNEWHVGSGRPGYDIPNFVVEIGNDSYRTVNEQSLALNTWYHIVAIRKSMSLELFINGENKSSVQIPAGAINNVGRELSFGKFGGASGVGNYYNQGAKIDEVMLFNRALNVEEIAIIYEDSPEGEVPNALEYQALIDLYNNTNGAGWSNKTNWLQGSTLEEMATWYGVTVVNGDITSLSLALNNLTGVIPTSIGNLKKLSYLNLGINEISGSIPESIGELKELTGLHLGSNKLSGLLPLSIGNLVALKNLQIFRNELTGSIPDTITALTNLQHLYLYENQLIGAIPQALGNMESLETIQLEGNLITGNMPSSIKDLNSLVSFNCNHCKMTGPIPRELTSLPNLKYLLLRHNRFTTFPDDIGKLTKLIQLDITGNGFTGPLPESIGSLTSLHQLFLAGNNFSKLPSSLGNLTQLTRLTLSDLPINGPLPEWISNLRKLELLYAYNCGLTGEIPEWIGELKELHWLYLYNNNLTGEFPKAFANLTRLGLLYLHYNQLEGPIPDYFGGFKNLRYLLIYRNRFSGALPDSMLSLSNLLHVRISDNNFSSIPNYSNTPQAERMNVKAHNNSLKFEDLEKNYISQSKSVFASFTYKGQSPLPADSLAFAPGQSVIFDTEDNAPHNLFQWQQLDNGVWTNIEGATESIFQVDTIKDSNIGSYRCRITNEWVIGTTIFSRTFVLQTTSQFYSVADGNWTTDRIWSTTKGGAAITGYPQGDSKVFIVGNNVTLDTSLSCGPLEVIVENSAASLTVDGADIIVQGDVKLTKTTEGFPGNIKVINGGKLKPLE